MASISLLRCCRNGSQLLFRSQTVSSKYAGLVKQDACKRMFSATPTSSAMLDYFRARRGPFTPAEKQGHHMMMASTHWKVERVVAVSMIGIMPACLFVQGPVMDVLLSTTVFLHGFWGLDGVLSDYVEKFFPLIHYLWYAVSILAFAGLVHFNYNDVGVTKAIKMLWSL